MADADAAVIEVVAEVEDMDSEAVEAVVDPSPLLTRHVAPVGDAEARLQKMKRKMSNDGLESSCIVFHISLP